MIVKKRKEKKTIGIYTKDFSLYHDLLKCFKKRGLAYVSLTSSDHIPRRIGVILTSHREIHTLKTPKVIAADAYEDVDAAIEKALHLLIGKDIYETVFIGIDPGEKPGIAVVGDDILLCKTQSKSPGDVFKKIKKILDNYPSYEYIIRIGHGSIISRNRIINSLIPLGIPIEIVDESKTSSSQQTQRAYRDMESAAAIALLKGGKVQRKLPLEPSKGEIRNIQEKSRKITDGRFSISEKRALDVLKGKKSLDEVIKTEKKRKNHTP